MASKKDTAKSAGRSLKKAAEWQRDAADKFGQIGDNDRAKKYSRQAKDTENDSEEIERLTDPRHG